MAEKFSMVISTDSRKYYLICELINRNQAFETFRIYPEKDHLNFIEIKGNRPMLRNKGLKRKAIKWEVKGEVRYQRNVEQAIKLIENYLESKPVKKKTVEQAPSPAALRVPKRKDPYSDRRTLDGKNKIKDT